MASGKETIESCVDKLCEIMEMIKTYEDRMKPYHVDCKWYQNKQGNQDTSPKSDANETAFDDTIRQTLNMPKRSDSGWDEKVAEELKAQGYVATSGKGQVICKFYDEHDKYTGKASAIEKDSKNFEFYVTGEKLKQGLKGVGRDSDVFYVETDVNGDANKVVTEFLMIGDTLKAPRAPEIKKTIDAQNWTKEAAQNWGKSLGSAYVPLADQFLSNEIDGPFLLERVDGNFLKDELKVGKKIQVKKILHELAKLKHA
jgi:hypothetical protein